MPGRSRSLMLMTQPPGSSVFLAPTRWPIGAGPADPAGKNPDERSQLAPSQHVGFGALVGYARDDVEGTLHDLDGTLTSESAKRGRCLDRVPGLGLDQQIRDRRH